MISSFFSFWFWFCKECFKNDLLSKVGFYSIEKIFTCATVSKSYLSYIIVCKSFCCVYQGLQSGVLKSHCLPTILRKGLRSQKEKNKSSCLIHFLFLSLYHLEYYFSNSRYEFIARFWREWVTIKCPNRFLQGNLSTTYS